MGDGKIARRAFLGWVAATTVGSGVLNTLAGAESAETEQPTTGQKTKPQPDSSGQDEKDNASVRFRNGAIGGALLGAGTGVVFKGVVNRLAGSRQADLDMVRAEEETNETRLRRHRLDGEERQH